MIGGFGVDHGAKGHGVLCWTDNTHGGLVWRGRVGKLRFLQLRLRELQTARANAAMRRSDGAGARVALLMVIMSHEDVTQPVARPSTHSRFHWIAGSAVVVLIASILTGCFIETGRYHRPYHRVIVVR